MEKKELIAMRSLTQALGIKDLLKKNGIAAQLVRSPGGASGGCGYSLYVPKNAARARAIIRSHTGTGGGA